MQKELLIKVKSNNSYESWVEFINLFRYKTNSNCNRVIFDFSEHSFIYPYELVSIACLIEEYYLNDVEIIFANTQIENKVVKYLNKLRFFDYWEIGYDRSEYTENLERNSLFLWKTSIEKLDPLAIYVQSFYENNYFADSDCTNLNNALTETVNNIYDHAGYNGISYAFAQYYPSEKIFKVSVCDFGIGIPEKVNQFLQNIGMLKLNNEIALQKAFEFKFTTKSTPRNRGFGLDNLRNCVTDGQGELYCYSTNATYSIKQNGIVDFKIQENFFPGTLIDIKIDASNLPVKDFFGGDYKF